MNKINNDNESQGGLARRLGLFDSTMMMVGIVIGSGIFLVTGIMAKTLPSGGFILLAWAVGGILALAEALTFAELGQEPHLYSRFEENFLICKDHTKHGDILWCLFFSLLRYQQFLLIH